MKFSTFLRWVGAPLRLGMIGLITGYQRFISPLRGPTCKYYPSCSRYGLEAFRTHGFFKGFLLTTGRVFRCNPWSQGGVNPIPEPGAWMAPVDPLGQPRSRQSDTVERVDSQRVLSNIKERNA